MRQYHFKKKELKLSLALSISKIHLSFDIWTAGNWIGVISIWAYWIDSAGARQRRLLAFRRIYRSHSGENQAAIILDVLKEYEIKSDKLGVFVRDNATSNDSAVALVLKALYPGITNQEVVARRLRCFGHIINLAAQALLDPTAAEAAIAVRDLEINGLTPEDVVPFWQSTGPLAKLHRLIKYILASPQRRDEFGEIKGGRKVKEYDHLGVSPFSMNIFGIEVYMARVSASASAGGSAPIRTRESSRFTTPSPKNMIYTKRG